MKKQITLAVSLSLAGSLVSIGSADAAIFQIGLNSLQGSSSPTGVYGQGIDSTDTPFPPAQNFFGTEITGPSVTIAPDTPGDFTTFDYAIIEDPFAAPTSTAATFVTIGSTGGFSPIGPGAAGDVRSFVSVVEPGGDAGFTFVNDFLSYTLGDGLDVKVDLNGVIESSAGAGGAVTFTVPVIVTAFDGIETETIDGTFRFSTQNISAAFAVDGAPLATGNGNEIDVFTGGQSYSWQLDVVKNVSVPEPSSMVSLLALGVLGGGMAMKRKVSK
ncbi:PEP-CTERM sorting domain-containing protein [Crocosphaera chwakensis]|uniref:Ice-binding protein C-terminal domain-containing protein n=1 Tax=Crocosphaera chwakensis CCY0110 TaxID=391612 RepID=A3IP45_9CHRO|nr:PEP-CTERM sorting domain-containing protein [Crocosphaera chwakensis]EAZ91847.1 hypothetical protein CY0110_07799 [Crocosphaera chwakensis CCY0110]